MICYRIVREVYQDDISGEGAEKHGGRWNSIGVPALYCCENRSLALLEVLANTYPGVVLTKYVIVTIEFPDTSKIFTPKENDLPENWHSVPLSSITKKYGDGILDKTQYLGIKVPSSVMPLEYNYVLNPKHPDYKKVKIKEKKPFVIDARL